MNLKKRNSKPKLGSIELHFVYNLVGEKVDWVLPLFNVLRGSCTSASYFCISNLTVISLLYIFSQFRGSTSGST